MTSPTRRHRPIRLLLIDDSPIIRLGLRSALEDFDDITIVGEAGNAASGLAAADRDQPDVVLLDLNLPDKSGIQTCRELLKSHPMVRVLILTSSNQEQSVQAALNAGAHGYLLKENEGDMLADSIRTVAQGSSVLDPAMTNQVMNLVKQHRAACSAADKLAQLSPQERRIVALLADGMTNKQIGEQMHLTEKTVKNYLANIFSKLNIERRTQAAALHVEAHQLAKHIAGDR